MDYEYALLEKQSNRHINCSPGRDHNVDYRRAHSTERSAMILLLFFQQCGVSFRKQAFPLSAVG